VQFSGDPRTVPYYAFYSFKLGTHSTEVIGTITGVSGSNYLHAHWSITRSKHFIVYHTPYELQGSDRQYLNRLEEERSAVQRLFEVRLPPVAKYYLYPDTATMARLTQKACGAESANVGCTDPFSNPPTIQTSLWPTYHEPIHVYQVAFQPRPKGSTDYVAPLFIAEGMAVALEDRTADPRLSDYCSSLVYIPLDACARVGMSETSPLILLDDAGFKRSDLGNAYALAGSFVKYLILKYGYVRFGHFYYTLAAQPSDTVKDYDTATHAVYGTTIDAMLTAWQRALCSSGCSH
jgi:hypothetical protein